MHALYPQTQRSLSNVNLIPEFTRRSPNIDLLLAHRLRCWASKKPTLRQRDTDDWVFVAMSFLGHLSVIMCRPTGGDVKTQLHIVAGSEATLRMTGDLVNDISNDMKFRDG